MILAALLCDVPSDHLLVRSDSGDEIPHAPYASVDVHLAYEPEFRFEYGTGPRLQSLHDGGNGEVGRYLDLEMHMVVVGVERMDVGGGVFLGGRIEVFPQRLPNVRLEVFPAISRAPYDAVLDSVLAVVQAPGSHEYGRTTHRVRSAIHPRTLGRAGRAGFPGN